MMDDFDTTFATTPSWCGIPGSLCVFIGLNLSWLGKSNSQNPPHHFCLGKSIGWKMFHFGNVAKVCKSAMFKAILLFLFRELVAACYHPSRPTAFVFCCSQWTWNTRFFPKGPPKDLTKMARTRWTPPMRSVKNPPWEFPGTLPKRIRDRHLWMLLRVDRWKRNLEGSELYRFVCFLG